MDDVKIRINVDGAAIAKTAMVISNGVVMAANVFLLGSSIHQGIRVRKQARVSESLNVAVEVSQSLAGLTKVITEIVNKNHVQTNTDL